MFKIGKTCWSVLAALLICFSPVFAAEVANKEVKVNINTATLQELDALKGVGPKLAARIIDYRKANGAFAKPEDIIKVSGIGPKVFEANKNIIVVGAPAAKSAPTVKKGGVTINIKN